MRYKSATPMKLNSIINAGLKKITHFSTLLEIGRVSPFDFAQDLYFISTYPA